MNDEIIWTEALAEAIKSGKKVSITLEGRFVRVEAREVATFTTNCGEREHPILRSFLRFKPDKSDDYIDLTITPPWEEMPNV